VKGGGRIDVEDLFEDSSGERSGHAGHHAMLRRPTVLSKLCMVIHELLWLPALLYLIQAIFLLLFTASVTIGMWTFLLSTIVLAPFVYLTHRRIKREQLNDEIATALKPCPCKHCTEARQRAH